MKQKQLLFIGLGNYPDQYKHTRHNIGKDFLLFLYDNLFQEKKLYLIHEEIINAQNCIFIIPQSYMNTSGDIFKDNYLKKITLEGNVTVIIIHDDLEVPFGKYRLRNNKERGERGHNGNRSINLALKSIQKENYKQPYYLSIGIGRPNDGIIDKWVLKKFYSAEVSNLENDIYPNIKNELIQIIKFIIINS